MSNSMEGTNTVALTKAASAVPLDKAKTQEFFTYVKNGALASVQKFVSSVTYGPQYVNQVVDENHQLDTPLRRAVELGNTKMVKLLLDLGANSSQLLTGNKTVLHYAAQAGDVKIFALLVERGADPNATDKFAQRPIWFAAEKGNYEIFKYLHKHKADISEGNWKLLRCAASNGNFQIVQYLLDNGADVNAANKDGMNSVYLAAAHGFDIVLTLLLNRGGSVDSRVAKDGWTPLHAACESGTAKVVEVLIERGADVGCEAQNGETPIFVTTMENKAEIAQVLIDHGADINKRAGKRNDTVLQYAVFRGALDVAEVLIDAGAEVDSLNSKGQTALHLGCILGSTSIVEKLLEKGAKASVPDELEKTPLYYAAVKGHERIVEILVQRGADISAVNQNMLRSAVDKKKMIIAMALVDAGAIVDKDVLNSLDFLQNDAQLAEFSVRFSKSLNKKQNGLIEEMEKLYNRIKEKTPLSPLVQEKYAREDEKTKGYAEEFRKLLVKFYSIQNFESASLYLGFIVNKCSKLEHELESAANIELKKSKENQLRLLYWSAKTILDSPFVVPRDLYVTYSYVMDDKSSREAHQSKRQLLTTSAYKNERLSLMSDIVNRRLYVLIHHPKVQSLLVYKWKREPVRFFAKLPWAKGGRAAFILNVILFIGILSLVSSIALLTANQNDPLNLTMTNGVQVSASDSVFQTVNLVNEFWQWTSQLALTLGSSSPYTILTPFIMRQFRVRNDSCTVLPDFSGLSNICTAEFSEDVEDISPFGPLGNPNKYTYTVPKGNSFPSISGVWYPNDGGYVISFDNVNSTDLTNKLSELENDGWFNTETAVVLVEFVAWNPNMNRFCAARMMLERLTSGALVSWSTFDVVNMKPYANNLNYYGKVLLGLEIVAIILFVYFLIGEITQMFTMKRNYFSDKWNYLDLTIIAVAFTVIGLKSTVYSFKSDVITNLDDSDTLLHFFRVLEIERIQNAMLSVLAILCWFNLFRYMRVWKDFGVLFRIFTKMILDVGRFFFVFLVFVLSFAMAFHMMVGHKIYDFRSWGNSILSLFRMIVGDFRWDPLERTNLLFGMICELFSEFLVRVLFFIYLGVAPILLINLLIAMLNRSYADVIEKANTEYELEFASLVLQYTNETPVRIKSEVVQEVEDDKKTQSIELKVLDNKDTSSTGSPSEGKREITDSSKSDSKNLQISGISSEPEISEPPTPAMERKEQTTPPKQPDNLEILNSIKDLVDDLKKLKELNESLADKQKEIEVSFERKLQDIAKQVTGIRTDLKKDELDLIYSKDTSSLF